MIACSDPLSKIGVVRGLLDTATCNVSTLAEAGYNALTGPASIFPAALTALLTIYVAVLGYRLLFGLGGLRLSDAPLIALKVSAILALTLNWNTFQTLVFDVWSKAPLEVARTVAVSKISPLVRLQNAYDELMLDRAAFVRLAAQNPLGLRGAEGSTADGLSQAATALFVSTAGILAIATVAIGVLVAVGPVFLALFLFDVTRGLFVGWVRAVTAAALTPMVCWITTILLLVTLEPWLAALATQRRTATLSVDTATSVIPLIFVFAAAQAALVAAGAIIAAGFHLPRSVRLPMAAEPTGRSSEHVTLIESSSRVQLLAQTLRHVPTYDGGGERGLPSYLAGGDGRGGDGGGVYFPLAAEASPRAVRLGEAYRRGAVRQRPNRRTMRSP